MLQLYDLGCCRHWYGNGKDRDYPDAEFQKLIAEIDRVAENTQWNGGDIIDGTAGSAELYRSRLAPMRQTVTVAFGNMTDGGSDNAGGYS